jgi:hypothetical protein
VFLEPESVSNFFIFTLLESKSDENLVSKFADYLVNIYVGEDVMACALVDTYLTTNAANKIKRLEKIIII